MSKDSSYTYINFAQSRHADLFEEFNRAPHLPKEDIYVPPQHQPPNPEDEDDVVPDQHAAFGIQRATQAKRETAWKDLGLEELIRTGPKEGPSNAVLVKNKGVGGLPR
ncbi:hypothetical protein MMC25_003385 [Agyrium rufum]|nr:hypothetical protein [Agyrium rufum]